MKKKNQAFFFMLFLMGALGILLTTCKNDEDNNPQPPAGTVTDIDGNVYHTVTICSKIWMVENLRTTRYNDGEAIPLVTDSIAWDTLNTPAFCWYRNDKATYGQTYGAMYNWLVVNSGKLAPKGWHIPTIMEWDKWITCIGGDSAAGDKMKETGTLHWKSPNAGATNEFGFTALPAGLRGTLGSYSGLGECTYWWTSSGNLNVSAWYVNLYYLHSYPLLNICNLQPGFSIRCVKD